MKIKHACETFLKFENIYVLIRIFGIIKVDYTIYFVGKESSEYITIQLASLPYLLGSVRKPVQSLPNVLRAMLQF